MQARNGALVDALAGSGLVALDGSERRGLITWLRGPESSAELACLAIAEESRGRGIGRALVDAAIGVLRTAGVDRAWVVTTNENLAALALYQKAGFRLTALRAGAVDDARRLLKPAIPTIGEHGIPIRDEIELAKDL